MIHVETPQALTHRHWEQLKEYLDLIEPETDAAPGEARMNFLFAFSAFGRCLAMIALIAVAILAAVAAERGSGDGKGTSDK